MYIYIFYIYIDHAQFSYFVHLRLLVFFLMYFYNRNPFDNSVYYTDGIILKK